MDTDIAEMETCLMQATERVSQVSFDTVKVSSVDTFIVTLAALCNLSYEAFLAKYEVQAA